MTTDLQNLQQTPTTVITLDAGARVSESRLWEIQTDYYKHHGLDAWKKIPYFATGNTFIAESYASMIMAWLQDALESKQLDLAEPLYILELATGPGRFSFYLLNELTRKLAHTPRLQGLQLRYVMTDFTEQTLDFWQQHEKLKPFTENGMLDFALFEPTHAETLTLKLSGKTLEQKDFKNPVLAIANYFFDSLPCDVFRIENKQLQEGRLTLTIPQDKYIPDEPVNMEAVTTQYTWQPVPVSYYENSGWNTLLKEYCETFERAHIVFPTGTFTCIENLLQLTNNRLVLISSDKGPTDQEQMLTQYEPAYALHDGAFSFQVNYHALGRFCEQRNGAFYKTEEKGLLLSTVMAVFDSQKEHLCLQYYFDEIINELNPANTYFGLKYLLDQPAEPSFYRTIGILAFLRSQRYDPYTFCTYAQHILNCLEGIEYRQRIDLLTMMEKTWDNFYYFPGEMNLPYWLGQMLLELSLFDQSMDFFKKSMDYFGESEWPYFGMGRCLEKQGRGRQAIEFYERALTFNTDFQAAKERIAAIRIVLGEHKLDADWFM